MEQVEVLARSAGQDLDKIIEKRIDNSNASFTACAAGRAIIHQPTQYVAILCEKHLHAVVVEQRDDLIGCVDIVPDDLSVVRVHPRWS